MWLRTNAFGFCAQRTWNCFFGLLEFQFLASISLLNYMSDFRSGRRTNVGFIEWDGHSSFQAETLFALLILVVAPVLASSQSPKPKTHSTITGCLTSNGDPDEYQLVDEKGITNL